MTAADPLPLAAEPNLPEGWATSKLKDVVTGIVDGSHNPPEKQSSGLPMLSARNIEGGEIRFDNYRLISPSDFKIENARTQVSPGDVLLTIVGSIGRSAVVPAGSPPFTLQRSVAVLKRPAIDPDFLARQFDGPVCQSYFAEEGAGTAQKGIYLGKLSTMRLSVAPLAEQERIVAKVEQLLARVNAARERLARLPALLKRFRQAVLAAACSGRLTADWRAQRKDSEPASVLVENIQKVRAERSSAKRRAKPRGTVVVEDQGETPESEIPESWTYCSVDQIATVCLGGTPSRKVPGYWEGGIAWVSSGEVANCRINSTRERITRKGLENSSAKIYPPGTVLIAMIGEGKTRGQSAILQIDACTNQNVAALLFDAGNIHPEYIWLWAMSEYERNRAVGRGGAQPALNGDKVRGLKLALAPLEEQHEILRRVEVLFKLADAIEKRIAAATARADKLTQAILAKAFRGELVPTEAELARREGRSYEPASALLARIRASANGSEPKRKSKH